MWLITDNYFWGPPQSVPAKFPFNCRGESADGVVVLGWCIPPQLSRGVILCVLTAVVCEAAGIRLIFTTILREIKPRDYHRKEK